MYEAYFGLVERPFSSVPQVEHYFPGQAIEPARRTLIRCVERAEGTGVAVGPSGTGKTLLCQLLAAHLRTSFQVAVLSSGRLTSRRELLQAILFELGQRYRDMDEGELRLALVDYVTNSADCPHGLVLVADEAHTLPMRLLEEIRMITNLVSGGQAQVRPVLVGGPLLEERLASPKLDSFNQRIVARCYLEAFSRTETQEYIQSQLQRTGGQPHEIISPEACQAIFQATDGIPRLINQVCDHALVLAYASGSRPVSRAGIEEAWADLQQLPTPWNADAPESSEAGVIEFGGLDDESDDSRHAGDEGPITISMLDATGPLGTDKDTFEQVDDIQQTLDRLEDEFHPAKPSTPKVTLLFESSADPFSEPFDEEEVVVDSPQTPEPTIPKTIHIEKVAQTSPPPRAEDAVREAVKTAKPATADDRYEPDRPTASSGNVIVEVPNAEVPDTLNPQPEPIAARVKPIIVETKPVVVQVEPAVVEPKPVAAQIRPIAAETKPDAARQDQPPEVASVRVPDPMEATVVSALPRETVRLHTQMADEASPRTQRNPKPSSERVLVVEEHYDDDISPVLRTPIPVRQQDYRRLFTTLRGCQ